MAEHHIKLNIGSKAELTAFDKVKSAVRGLGQSMKSSLAGIGQNLMNIKAGFEMLGSAIRTAYSGLKKAFDFQTMTQQFKFLLGSMDEAKQHMETLKELGATPPFSMEEFAAASRQMVLLSDGVLGLEDSLKLVGDVAAATGRPVEEVGEAVARAYSMIRDGQPVQRAVFQLRNMGAITPKVADELKSMQETGANGVQIWEKLEEALGKYSGAMNETANTVNGALGALGSAWDDAMRDLGESASEALVGPLNSLTQWIRDLEENGTLEDWGSKVVEVMTKVGKVVGWVAEKFGMVKDHLKEGRAFLNGESSAENAAEEAKENLELVYEEKINPYRTKKYYSDSQGRLSEKLEVNKRAEKKWLREKQKAERQAAEREKVRKSLENSKMASKPEKKAEKASRPNGQYQSEDDYHRQSQENIKAYRDAMRKFRLEGAKKDAEAQIEAQKKTKDMLEDKIDKLDEKLKKLNDTEKEVADKVKKAEEARRNDPNSQVTGEGRKAARNAQQNAEAEAVKQRNREKARENRMENLEKIAGRRGGLNWLSKKQIGELQAWWNEKNNKKKLEEIKNQVKQAEKERKEYQEKMKKIPDRIKSIQDNLDKFIKQNEVA